MFNITCSPPSSEDAHDIEICRTPLLLWVLQDFTLSPVFFNIYMKPPRSSLVWVLYHQYADNTQLYLLTLGQPSEDLNTLILEAGMPGDYVGLDGEKPSLSQSYQDQVASLSLDGVSLPPLRLIHIIGDFLDLHLLLKEQVSAVATTDFA